ncbi:hypothetical protein AB9T88_17675, partial [Flavobacterium sp. LBUM151]
MSVFRIFLLLVFLFAFNVGPVFCKERSSLKTIGFKESKKEIHSDISSIEKKQLRELEKSTNKKVVSLFIVLTLLLMVLFYYVYQN